MVGENDGSVGSSLGRQSDGGYVNNGFARQESDGSLYDLNRRTSLSRHPLPTNIPKKKDLTRRLSTFTSSHVTQNFTEQAKKTLSKFTSVNYAPSHSLAYMEWLRSHGHRRLGWQWGRWMIAFWIGILTGMVAVFLNQCIQALSKVKFDHTKEYAANGDILTSWGWTVGISCVFILISSVLIAFVHPPAAGGGTPEVIAYLNGVMVHGVFGLKNLIVKFTSNVFAVSSGLPCAIQGPIIAFGAIVGMGVGQFRSKTLNCAPKVAAKFRNAEDRRAFTTAGVAAGVAAAFNAPIGGLLFAMEDLSSFWSKRLSWLVFFTSVVATAVAGLFQTAFKGFKFNGTFGLFSLSLTEPIQIHIAILPASIALGLVGGILGASFTRLNIQVVGVARKLVLSKFKKPFLFKCARVFETIILVFIMSTYHSILPMGFDCTNFSDIPKNVTRAIRECVDVANNNSAPFTLNPFLCDPPNGTTDIYYNEVATIVQNGGTTVLDILWSRGTHYYFRWYILLTIFVFWYFMSIWTLGSAIAGGIFVPTLITGSMYGRALGVGMLAIYKSVSGEDFPVNTAWDWIDPGIMAVIGAGSLLGGVTRLALASTVIVVEMAQDINMVIPVLIAVWVAKMVADVLSKPLYKCQLEGKALPYLDQEPDVAIEGHIVNLELASARDVMASPVRTVQVEQSVGELARLLTETSHEGFPVVKRDPDTGLEVCYGLISRIELLCILCDETIYGATEGSEVLVPRVSYDDISVDYMSDRTKCEERVRMYTTYEMFRHVIVNLEPYINISAAKVDVDFSLSRTYSLFRTLGLRHLVVVDIRNQVVGIITRQDLMAFNIQERLSSLPKHSLDTPPVGRKGSGNDVMLPAITLPHISEKVEESDFRIEEEKRDPNSNAPSDTYM